MSKQTAIGYGVIYENIKHLVDENFDPKFFEMMRCDYMLSSFGLFVFDIVGMDSAFEKMETIIPEWLFDDKSHGRFTYNPHGSKAWRFNEGDEWNYDFEKMPPLKVYDATACTYKGKDCSMREYVAQRWGQKYVEIIEAANKTL